MENFFYVTSSTLVNLYNSSNSPQGRVVSTSEKEKKAITDLLSLLGLNLDGLIIEEVPSKLPIDQQQQHKLILSIKAPLDQEDLFQPSDCTQIKRSCNMQQKMAFFIMPSLTNIGIGAEESKTSWIQAMKEGTYLDNHIILYLCNL